MGSDFEREPIFHDRQAVQVAGPITTSSASFVPIPGATLTTKNLGQTGFYQFWVDLEAQHTNNNQTINIRACINGTPSGSRSINFGPNSANEPHSATLIGESANVPAGAVIQLEWSTTAATAQINELILMFDGIPDNRIIP
jgi:hypothetical protein